MRWLSFRRLSVVSLLFSISLIPGVVSCSGESDEVARKKLEVILADDMTAILEDVPDSATIEKPYFNLISYQTYEKGNYSKKAVADFFFLKKVELKIIRKYRYHRTKRMWERYFNEYSFFADTTHSSPDE